MQEDEKKVRDSSDISDVQMFITVNSSNITLNEVIKLTTEDYLKRLDKDNPPAPSQVERELINLTNENITICNINIPVLPMKNPDGSVQTDKNGNPKGCPLRPKWRPVDRLVPQQIADVALFFYDIIRIDTTESGSEEDLVGVYITSGKARGTYDYSESYLFTIFKQFDYQLDEKKYKDIYYIIKSTAPKKTRCCRRNLVAVQNGIFDYDTKQLMDFDPQYVFLSKSQVAYNPTAVNPVIHNNDDNTDWDVESWMNSLSDDPEIVNLLWQMMSAIIRPFVRWNKSIWLYSTTGNNGKGTLCELMRNLCGTGAHTSIKLSQFDAEFALEPLIKANAIIVDENDVGLYIDRLANLKAVVTNDIVQINRKFKAPISFRFWGFMVQCINDLPRIRDKSDSFYRRQILVPMEKCFTGAERAYIKNDYLHRQDVLEYVLYKVLNSNFYEIEPPEKCKSLLGTYKELNDPVREFANEFFDQFTWDLVPFSFVYDIYKEWFKEINPSGKPEGRTSFLRNLKQIIISEPAFSQIWSVSENAVSTKSTICTPEPLLERYKLNNWRNYTGNDYNKLIMPYVRELRLRGFLRRSNALCSSSGQTKINPEPDSCSSDNPELFSPQTPAV